ncbi:MAG: two pore domain potassium channel family protein [Rhodospirillales bacterium]|nr:two pore domain potassium channel family protein [Rhodospirillales bacterium]
MSVDLAVVFARWRFLLLTLLICAYLLTAPLIVGSWLVQMVLEALLLATVLVTVSANPGWRTLRSVLILLWLLSMAGTMLSVFSIRPELWQWYRTVELMTLVPVLVAVAAGMLAFVRRERTLTIDSIFATVAAYLLLALLFTQFYLCLITWHPASFSLPVEIARRPVHLLQSDMIYFSLVTLATVGYGDVLPVSHTARMLATLQAVVGQFYFAVVVALFVGSYSSQQGR